MVKPFKIGDLLTAVEIALERHALETQHPRERAWFSTVLRSIGDAVLCTDLDGRVSFMNPRAEALTGWSFADAHERPVAEVVRIASRARPARSRLPWARRCPSGRSSRCPTAAS